MGAGAALKIHKTVGTIEKCKIHFKSCTIFVHFTQKCTNFWKFLELTFNYNKRVFDRSNFIKFFDLVLIVHIFSEELYLLFSLLDDLAAEI